LRDTEIPPPVTILVLPGSFVIQSLFYFKALFEKSVLVCIASYGKNLFRNTINLNTGRLMTSQLNIYRILNVFLKYQQS